MIKYVSNILQKIKRSRKIGKIAQYRRLVVAVRNRIMKMMPNALAAGQTKFLYKSKEK